MKRMSSNSISRVRWAALQMMLCSVVAVWAGGCAGPPAEQPVLASASSKKNFAVSETEPRTASESERVAADAPVQAVESASKLEPEPEAPREPVDPGGSELVQRLAETIGVHAEREPDEVTRIGVWSLRNHSRCRSAEFSRFLDRFAEVMSGAGEGDGYEFTADDADAVDYHLEGTAYLITTDGFDLWELFVSLRPAGSSVSMWVAPGSVNVLRQPRPNQPQIFLGRGW